MSLEILDPTHEADELPFLAAPRLSSLSGATVALLSNGKRGTRPFFDALEQELLTRYEVRAVERMTKANFSAPAEPQIFDAAREWDALIAGVGD